MALSLLLYLSLAVFQSQLLTQDSEQWFVFGFLLLLQYLITLSAPFSCPDSWHLQESIPVVSYWSTPTRKSPIFYLTTTVIRTKTFFSKSTFMHTDCLVFSLCLFLYTYEVCVGCSIFIIFTKWVALGESQLQLQQESLLLLKSQRLSWEASGSVPAMIHSSCHCPCRRVCITVLPVLTEKKKWLLCSQTI